MLKSQRILCVCSLAENWLQTPPLSSLVIILSSSFCSWSCLMFFDLDGCLSFCVCWYMSPGLLKWGIVVWSPASSRKWTLSPLKSRKASGIFFLSTVSAIYFHPWFYFMPAKKQIESWMGAGEVQMHFICLGFFVCVFLSRPLILWAFRDTRNRPEVIVIFMK